MGLFGAFQASERGTVAALFGVSLLPVLGFVGVALDYSRATAARTQMQRAVDVAALALVRDAGSLTDAQLRARGREVFQSAFQPGSAVTAAPLDVTRQGKTIRVAASGDVRTSVLSVLGQDRIAIGAEAQSTWSSRKIQIALVLDNTGSMNDVVKGLRKIDELKKASLNLLDTLKKSAPDDDAIRVSIVPFDTMVRLEPTGLRNADWIDFDAVSRTAWTGYLLDREQPFDASGGSPKPGVKATLQPASARGGTDLAAIMPLTSARAGHASLVAKIGQMKAAGCTNITIGAVWGLASLTNASGLTGAASGSDVEKIVILLTDGDNTQNRWVNDCSSNGDRKEIDARTRDACASVRAGTARFYTIRLVDGNKNLLRDCASLDAKGKPLFYDVQDAARISAVFQEIVSAILGTRLTQ